MLEDASYVCDSCGEEIVVEVDLSGGSHQEYVEDCPVCCHPIRIRVGVYDDGAIQLDAEHE